MVPADNNMLREIALSLYGGFHKEDGREEDIIPFTTGKEWFHSFSNRFHLINLKIIEQAISDGEEAVSRFGPSKKLYQERKFRSYAGFQL
jgi:hypothetical protein